MQQAASSKQQAAISLGPGPGPGSWKQQLRTQDPGRTKRGGRRAPGSGWLFGGGLFFYWILGAFLDEELKTTNHQKNSGVSNKPPTTHMYVFFCLVFSGN
jgi:hypothetical protein